VSQGRDGLPLGWAAATVGSISERVVVGFVGPGKQHYRPDGVPFLMGKNIRNGTIDLSNVEKITPSFHRSLPKSELHAGDVVVVRIGRSGDAAVVPESLGPANCSGLVIVKRPTGVSPEFLARYFNSPAGKMASAAEVRGVTRQTLNTQKIEQASVPVPPLNEQKRIVAKIEALQARSDAAREALDAIPPLLEQFRQSVLAAAFRGDLTKKWREAHPEVEPASMLLERIRAERRRRWEAANPKKKYVEPGPVDPSGLPALPEGWCWAAMEELTSAEAPVVYGIILPGPHVEGGVPFVRPADIRNGHVELDALPRTSPEIAAKYRRAALLPGDLVFSIVGTIGKWLIAPEWLNGANITQSSVRIRTLDPLTSEFVLRGLQAPVVAQQMALMAFGNAVQRLNVEDVRRLALPLPPWPEWGEMARVIRLALATVDTQRSRSEELAVGLESLNQSILAKAFRGELVPQDPSDEPASALLERIREAREESEATSPSRRRKGAASR
jgi:type I restriction enzyme S subunit